ncbi:MAG: hypothetical protein GY816_11050 [Cytophagales bacterium]|nr:hypothetical protein [Cytophagales bacterium]
MLAYEHHDHFSGADITVLHEADETPRYGHGGRNQRSVSKDSPMKKLVTYQIGIDKEIAELHRDLGHALENVSEETFCIHENSIGYLDIVKSNVARYTTFLRDVLELANPRSLRTGVRLFNILSDNQVSHIFQHINGINETIYGDNIPRFLEYSRGFITQIAYNKNSTVTMSIRIEIPWAYQNEMMQIFRVHQIGFIHTSGGPCSKLVLPKTIARRNSTFYRLECKSINCMTESFAPITPSCLGDGLNVSCAAHLSHCEQLASFTMASGILLTTNHDVYGVYRGGERVKLSGEGSLFVS